MAQVRGSLKRYIDAYLSSNPTFVNFNMSIERNEQKGFHPSALHYACSRAIAFQFLYESDLLKSDVKEDEVQDPQAWVTPQLRRTFDTGHVVHGLIQYSYLKGLGVNYRAEIPITSLREKYLISGTADLDVLMQDKTWEMWDIKTCRSSEFAKIKEDDPTCIKDGYMVQWNLYSLGMKRKRGGIYYWNKDDGNHKEVRLEFDKKHVIEPLKTALAGKSFILGSTVPILRECKKKTERYKSCPFTSLCFLCADRNVIKYTTKKNNSELIK